MTAMISVWVGGIMIGIGLSGFIITSDIPYEKIECRDNTYQILFENEDETRTWYDIKRECK